MVDDELKHIFISFTFFFSVLLFWGLIADFVSFLNGVGGCSTVTFFGF